MKDIKQKQEENRKAIICAVHGADDYEGALEREAKNHFLNDSDGPFGYGQWITIREGYIYKSYPDAKDDYVEEDFLDSVNDFASKLITLDRILLILDPLVETEVILRDGKIAMEYEHYIEENGFIRKYYKSIIWNLTKQTLEEQTEETQRSIWELINKGK